MDFSKIKLLLFTDRRGHEVSPRRLALLIVTVVAVVGMAFYLGWKQNALTTGSVTLADGQVITVEVASSERNRERGLAGRDGLAPGQGMLFVFPAADRYGFWMKGMNFSIDVVWLEQNRVVDITANVPVPPPDGPFDVYRPLAPADRVLELAAGEAAVRNIRLGDRLTIVVDSSADSR
ncbi:MAG: DUF192 domain-containing protein [Patescibacteria group bacterium]|nr:DUF192 domain-containing protein [Patescibacteria group bacterium]